MIARDRRSTPTPAQSFAVRGVRKHLSIVRIPEAGMRKTLHFRVLEVHAESEALDRLRIDFGGTSRRTSEGQHRRSKRSPVVSSDQLIFVFGDTYGI